MKALLRFACLLALLQSFAWPQTTDVLGMHNLSPGSGSSIYSRGSLGCTFCHAPHSGLGGNTPLWNQTLSQRSYTPYGSTTYRQQGNTKPTLGVTSSLCLSCHDGTVGVGQSAAYGKLPTTGNWNPIDSFGTTLTGSHPFSLVTPLKDAPNLVASLAAQGKTADTTGAVKLIKGNIECTSCHDPHVQNIDKVAQNFLVRDSSNGQMCLACHDPTRVVQGQINPLANWTTSIHKTATNQISADAHAGSYGTVAVNACTSCHMEHNAVAPARLLRPATPTTAGDPVTQDCMTCHNGGTYMSPAAPNIMAEVAKTGGHQAPAGNNFHDASEPARPVNNRHATCSDCHDAHGSNQVTTFTPPPALRPSQAGVSGVSALDGVTVLTPAINQYENCLRCHGTGVGKQRLLIYGYAPIRMVAGPDQLNVIPEFAVTATSSHPVVHDRSSPLPQPSLLTGNMLNQNGTASGRVVGVRIFCTDCHNSDDNREFGGTGANGPHGSMNPHILERNYQFSQAATPGGQVTNVFPNPDLTIAGPYAMCAKCHDLRKVLTDGFAPHGTHVGTAGFSCSVCHTAHGMGATSPTITGERLVNFDANVVGRNNGLPISYNHGTNTCTLTCHQVAHNADGSTASAASLSKPAATKTK